MTDQNAESVRLACPVCGWESATESVDPHEVNGVWFAFQRIGESYRKHYRLAHMPLPVRVQIDGSGSGT